ncbi:MAG: PLP-dependent lyase/thiolase [bacterium]|nr:PLP-dependent lyase/thiolase [bacterium]
MNTPSITPLISFSADSPFASVFIKREDQSDAGSHKFRYLKPLLKKYQGEGIFTLVLSTTGNAGITAAHYGRKMGITVFCLMSDRGDLNKAAQLEKEGAFVVLSSRPLRFAKYLAKRYKVPFPRISGDALALDAYASLGDELIVQAQQAKAIVNFATSGTSSLGLMRAYESKGLKLPALHLVQSGKSCSIVRELHPEQVPTEAEFGIGLSETPRKKELLGLIQKSGGDAWYVTDVDRQEAERVLLENHLETSWEGVCSFAIALRLKDRYESLVCIFSGKKWPKAELVSPRRAETFQDMDRLWEEFLSL